MADDVFNAVVANDLKSLIPGFMTNRHKELESLRAALAASDYEELHQLGHRMKGVGDSYGFNHVSVLGKEIEDKARIQDCSGLEMTIGTYEIYLSKVRITYT